MSDESEHLTTIGAPIGAPIVVDAGVDTSLDTSPTTIGAPSGDQIASEAPGGDRIADEPPNARGEAMASPTPETTASRAEGVQQVLQAAASETPAVKQAALSVLVPPPDRGAADIIWMMLVGGLIVILVLSVLALTHVLGHAVSEDKIVTLFTTVLAGLLGLFAKSPTGS
jgi:uncharacterized integral membrane protein